MYIRYNIYIYIPMEISLVDPGDVVADSECAIAFEGFDECASHCLIALVKFVWAVGNIGCASGKFSEKNAR